MMKAFFIFMALFLIVKEGNSNESGESSSSTSSGEEKKFKKKKSSFLKKNKDKLKKESSSEDLHLSPSSSPASSQKKKLKKSNFIEKKLDKLIEAKADKLIVNVNENTSLIVRAGREHAARKIEDTLKGTFPEGSEIPALLAKEAVNRISDSAVSTVKNIPETLRNTQATLTSVRQFSGEELGEKMAHHVSQIFIDAKNISDLEKEKGVAKKEISRYLDTELEKGGKDRDPQEVLLNFQRHKEELRSSIEEGFSGRVPSTSSKEDLFSHVWEKEFLKYNADSLYLKVLEEKMGSLRNESAQEKDEGKKKSLEGKYKSVATLALLYKNDLDNRRKIMEGNSVSPILSLNLKDTYNTLKPNSSGDLTEYKKQIEKADALEKKQLSKVIKFQEYGKKKIEEKQNELKKTEKKIEKLQEKAKIDKEILKISDYSLLKEIEKQQKNKETIESQLKILTEQVKEPIGFKKDPLFPDRQSPYLLTPKEGNKLGKEMKLQKEISFVPSSFDSINDRVKQISKATKELRIENRDLKSQEALSQEAREKIALNNSIIQENEKFLKNNKALKKENNYTENSKELQKSVEALKKEGEGKPASFEVVSENKGLLEVGKEFALSLSPWYEPKPMGRGSPQEIENLKKSTLAYQEHLKELKGPLEHGGGLEGTLHDLKRMTVDLKLQNKDLKKELTGFNEDESRSTALEKGITNNKNKIKDYNDSLHGKREEFLSASLKVASGENMSLPKKFSQAKKMIEDVSHSTSGFADSKKKYEKMEKKRDGLEKKVLTAQETHQKIPKDYQTEKPAIIQGVYDKNKKVIQASQDLIQRHQTKTLGAQHGAVEGHFKSLRKIAREKAVRTGS